jgi:hypothetical protein
LSDPRWTTEARDVLRQALRKAQAAEAQGEIVKFSGPEARALRDAAQCWEDMMTMLDARARAGDLKGVTTP